MVLASRALRDGSGACQRLDGLPHCPVLPIAEALATANVVLLCIPPASFTAFVANYRPLLAGKTVVDVSNPSRCDLRNIAAVSRCYSMAEHLEHLLEGALPRAQVVKAFNGLAAGRLLARGSPSAVWPVTVVAGKCSKARQRVADLAAALQISAQQHPALALARRLERQQLAVASRYRAPFCVSAALLLFYYLWQILTQETTGYWEEYHPGMDHPYWHSFLLYDLTNALGWQGLLGMTLVYLPGPLAYVAQQLSGSPRIRLWGWVKRWLDMRRELGLLSALALVGHLASGLTYLAAPQDWLTQWAYGFGTLAVVCLLPVAVTSLPSVAAALGRRDWALWQQLGWGALTCGVLHVMFYEAGIYRGDLRRLWGSEYKTSSLNKLPPIAAVLLPLTFLPLFLKFLAILPGLGALGRWYALGRRQAHIYYGVPKRPRHILPTYTVGGGSRAAPGQGASGDCCGTTV